MNSSQRATAAFCGVALFSSFLASNSVQAADMNEIMRGLLNSRNSSSSQNQTIVNLNSQRASLESRIQQGLSTGQLSAAQAESIRAQVNYNMSLQNQSTSDGNLDFTEAQAVLNGLNVIDTSLTAAIAAGVPTYTGQNGHPGNWNNGPGNWNNGQGNQGRGWKNNWNNGRNNRQQVSTARTDALFTSISAQLEAGRTDGRLTRDEYRMLKSDLTRVTNDKLASVRSNMFISRTDEERIFNRLTTLNTRTTRELTDNQIASRERRWQRY